MSEQDRTRSTNPSGDDAFVVAAVHRHLKEQLRSTGPRGTEYADGKRDALLEALGFLDGVSGGRYSSSVEGGAE
jgi:hypothetical protein